MNVRFWGVRGSIPTPLTPQQIQAKISAVVQRIQPEDIVSDESRKNFISSLPKWLYGTTGGNTPCVEVTGKNHTKILFDAGSGIRALGKLGVPPEDMHYNLMISHFHWDHIQGLPFFDRAYNPKASFDIYSPFADMERYLREQMVRPYYPVTWDSFTKNINFHVLNEGEFFNLGEFTVATQEMFHPGKSYSYLLEEDGHKFIYATDVELSQQDFERSKKHRLFFENADVLVLDSQYTAEEAYNKQNWGHSAFCYAVDFAVAWNVKKLYLFHHEPAYDDKKLNSILESARWYARYVSQKPIEIYLASEGMEIKL